MNAANIQEIAVWMGARVPNPPRFAVRSGQRWAPHISTPVMTCSGRSTLSRPRYVICCKGFSLRRGHDQKRRQDVVRQHNHAEVEDGEDLRVMNDDAGEQQ